LGPLGRVYLFTNRCVTKEQSTTQSGCHSMDSRLTALDVSTTNLQPPGESVVCNQLEQLACASPCI